MKALRNNGGAYSPKKEIAEKILISYPRYLVYENFTLDIGMAGLGDLYLEAFRVFKNDEWQLRADWITGFLTHTYRNSQTGTNYWLSNNSAYPTADLMNGNSGILYFLFRSLKQDKIGYHLLV